MWRDLVVKVTELENQLELRRGRARPQFIVENGVEIGCTWYGNECRLDESIVQLVDCAITSGANETASIHEAAAKSLAHLRFRVDDQSGRDWTDPPSAMLRRANSHATLKLFGEGEVDIEIDGNGHFEYAVDLGHALKEDVCFEVALIGWKLRD
jgi:hypothetical protein